MPRTLQTFVPSALTTIKAYNQKKPGNAPDSKCSICSKCRNCSICSRCSRCSICSRCSNFSKCTVTVVSVVSVVTAWSMSTKLASTLPVHSPVMSRTIMEYPRGVASLFKCIYANFMHLSFTFVVGCNSLFVCVLPAHFPFCDFYLFCEKTFIGEIDIV